MPHSTAWASHFDLFAARRLCIVDFVTRRIRAPEPFGKNREQESGAESGAGGGAARGRQAGPEEARTRLPTHTAALRPSGPPPGAPAAPNPRSPPRSAHPLFRIPIYTGSQVHGDKYLRGAQAAPPPGRPRPRAPARASLGTCSPSGRAAPAWAARAAAPRASLAEHSSRGGSVPRADCGARCAPRGGRGAAQTLPRPPMAGGALPGHLRRVQGLCTHL